MLYASGHAYAGEWENNKKNGRGVFTSNRGNIYDGYFKNDVKDGKGKMIYYPGTILEEMYDGDWKKGMRDGKGKYVYKQSEGTVYEGEWIKDLRHGKVRRCEEHGSRSDKPRTIKLVFVVSNAAIDATSYTSLSLVTGHREVQRR